MKLAEDVERRGGALLLVGGSVRDDIVGLPVKDFDVEIYHLPTAEIEELAKALIMTRKAIEDRLNQKAIEGKRFSL